MPVTMFRFEPLMAPQYYKTYMMSRPLKSHWERAVCADVDCPQYINGWATRVDETTDLGQAQAGYIRQDKSRSHTESRTAEGLTEFVFPPGQKCFAKHKQPVLRDAIFTIRGGDHRGNPMGVKTCVLPARQWVDDFGEHQEKLAELIQRG